jgi:hypothetical protein
MTIYQITHYLTDDQKAPYAEWFRQLRDPRAKAQSLAGRTGDGGTHEEQA